ncbi:MAG: hypothetical protein AB7P31_11795 [Steroidobacteraceae bacterium]
MPTRVATFGLALLQGLVLWWLIDAMSDKAWPATDPGLLAALLTPAVLVPPLVYLQLGLARLQVVLVVSAVAVLVLAGFGWHYGARVAPGIGNGYGADAFAFAIAVIVLCFHALPFLQSALETRRARPVYSRLFVFAWRNALQLALAVVFCAVLWALLGLWMQLFDMIGIGFFKRLFTDGRFATPLTTVAFAVAIGLAGSVERLQQALRQHLLGLFKWLAVLAMLILTLFSVALLAKSPELFAAGQRAISATWLLWLLVACVYLLNAAYQDGALSAPYPRLVGVAMRVAAPLLVVVALLAAYALGVRAGAYGLTVARIWAMLVALLLLEYAVGYAIAAWRPGAWMASMGAVNVVVALTLIGTLTLMLTPILSPYRLAAASQGARVLAGSGANDGYTALALDAGGYGRRRLAALAKLEGGAATAHIRASATAALELRSRFDRRPASPAVLALVAFPEGRTIDTHLRAAIAITGAGIGDIQCASPSTACPVLFVDLNRDGTEEAVVFTDGRTLLFERKDSLWEPRRLRGEGGLRAAALARLRAGDYRVVAPAWQALQVGEEHLVVDPGS